MRRVSCVSSNRSVKCWLIDRSRQGNGRKDSSCPPSRVGGLKCHRVAAKTQRVSARIQETAREGPQAAHQKSKLSSASLWLRQANLRHTFTGKPAEGGREGCLLTPKISGYPKNKPLGQEQLRKLRDHPAFPWGREHPKPRLAWGSPLAALAQEGSLPRLVGCGFSQAGLSFSGSGTGAFAKSYFSTQDLISQRVIHPP